MKSLFTYLLFDRRCLRRMPLLLLPFLLTECSKTDSAPAESAAVASTEINLTPEQEKTAGISLGYPEKRTMFDEVTLTGIVEASPQQTASVSFPLSGTVRAIYVQTGQQVQKGSRLAAMESMELIRLQEEYWRTLAQMTFARQERQRQAALSEEAIGAKQKLQQAEADERILEAGRQGLQAKLEVAGIPPDQLQPNHIVRTVVLRAPIAGVISATPARIGKTVTSEEVLFELGNTIGKRLILKGFEKDLPALQIGQKVVFNGGSAVITGLGNRFDPTTRTVDVYSELQNSGLPAGQYLTGRIETAPRKTLTLPETAIVRTGETAYVFVKIKQGTYRPVFVQTGALRAGFAEVTFSEKMTLPIVITGAQTLQAEINKGAGDEE